MSRWACLTLVLNFRFNFRKYENVRLYRYCLSNAAIFFTLCCMFFFLLPRLLFSRSCHFVCLKCLLLAEIYSLSKTNLTVYLTNSYSAQFRGLFSPLVHPHFRRQLHITYSSSSKNNKMFKHEKNNNQF